MKAKIHTTEQIISKLREVERFQAEGHSVAEACKQISVSEHTFYKWRGTLTARCKNQKLNACVSWNAKTRNSSDSLPTKP